MTTTVTGDNQVSVPPDIARDFDIHPGTRLEWSKSEDGLIFVKLLPDRGALARQLMGAGRRWLKPGVEGVGDLLHERGEDDKLDRAEERSSQSWWAPPR